MIQLATSFVSGEGGFSANPLTYTQLKRNDVAAVYERSRDGKVYDYETFLIKVDPKGKVFKFPNGVTKTLQDDMEKYPSSSQFGRIAWSFTSRGMAMLRFLELTQGKASEVVVEGDEKEAETPPANDSVDSAPSEPAEETDDKPYKGPDLLIPVGDFSTKELAEKNGVQYPIAFLFLKDREKKGKIKFVRKERRAAKGKPTSLFTAVTP